MNTQGFLPSLSAYDQPDTSEGALDPLGLYPISDALTVNKLCPGVRERQKHPGFLVPIAIGALVAEEFDGRYSDENGIPPIQIFEWYVVQSLVKTYRYADPDRLRGLPGRDKVSKAIDRFGSVNTENYLKTASVFGFYGVYKLLARNLGILHEDQPDSYCNTLISAWERDEKANNVNFRTIAELARDAIDYGLKYEKTNRNWPHWAAFAQSINPQSPGAAVSEQLWSRLTGEDEPLRAEYIRYMIEEGADVLAQKEGDERQLHNRLLRRASQPMRELLDTVQCYEEFARLLTDAFNQVLHMASATDRTTGINTVVGLENVQRAVKRLPQISTRLEDGLEAQGFGHRLAVFAPLFDSVSSAADWVEALLLHHISNQRAKPPGGKMPFFDRLENGSIITRPAYRLHADPGACDDYVHQYRSLSLCSFARDLGRLH